MHEHVTNNQEHVKSIRTIKNIQTYSRELSRFNLKFSSWQHKQTVKEMDYTFMQDPYGRRGTLDGGPKGGEKEELGEGE